MHEMHVRNSSDFYGASQIAANYCGIPLPDKPPRGLWHHGWMPVHYATHPEFLVPQDFGGDPTGYYWLARRDQEEYLRKHGYENARAIGVPFIYLPERKLERRKGSLLVMPVHTLEHINADWKFEEYARSIERIREQFSEVVVCVHPACFKRGYWVSDFRRLGFEVVSGARVYDLNALERMRYLLSTFEYLTTNGMGSHIAYGAYCGAKVSIYGPYAEYKLDDMKRDPFRASRPHLLEASLAVTSEAVVRRNLPEFFRHPLEAEERIDWGHTALGWESRVPPAELRELFEWRPVDLRAHSVRKGLQFGKSLRKGSFRNLVPEPIRHTAKLALRSEYRAEQRETRRLRRTPRFVLTSTLVNGKPFEILDSEAFLQEHRELFEEDRLRFECETESPYIIDGSAGCGLVVAYFKRLFPQCRVLALEPDDVMSRLLLENSRAAGWSNVEVTRKSLWPYQIARALFRRGGNAVGKVGRSDEETLEPVEQVSLLDYLREPVDLLRIDLEDADIATFRQCADGLGSVKRIVVDYYSTLYDRQSLHELTTILHGCGFRVHVHTSTTERRPFDCDLGDFFGVDQRLRLFGIRR